MLIKYIVRRSWNYLSE